MDGLRRRSNSRVAPLELVSVFISEIGPNEPNGSRYCSQPILVTLHRTNTMWGKKRPRSYHLLRHWEHRLICRQKRYRLSPQRRVQVCRMRQAVREGDKAWLKSENY